VFTGTQQTEKLHLLLVETHLGGTSGRFDQRDWEIKNFPTKDTTSSHPVDSILFVHTTDDPTLVVYKIYQRIFDYMKPGEWASVQVEATD
jgi:hypothetical protein